MAAEIGPGTRVWCGFCAESECQGGTSWARARTGTVMRRRVDGLSIIAAVYCGVTYWDVQIDGADEVGVREDQLFPMDDGDPTEHDESTERPKALEEA